MERRKILIATKTYPAISTKYKETVCTAGILLDDNEKPLEWIRIYPIRYRYLEIDKRYPRWAIISAKIEKNPKDFRAESFRIEEDYLNFIRKIGVDKKWEERKEYMLPFQFKSIDEIKQNKKSLGLIKPKTIEKYFYRKTARNWSEKKLGILNQLDLFEPTVDLEKIPYQFVYRFFDKDGVKHNYSISDWEIMQLYRNCRDNSNLKGLEAELDSLEKVRQKLEDDFMQKKDLYFIVGNLQSHPQNFMIIGLFYPPMIEYKQLSLFKL